MPISVAVLFPEQSSDGIGPLIWRMYNVLLTVYVLYTLLQQVLYITFSLT